MTSLKTAKDTDTIKTLLKEIKFLSTKKLFISTFIILALIAGFYYSEFKANPFKAEFQNTCSIKSNAVHSEIICDFLNSVNEMDITSKAQKLNIPISFAQHLKKINPLMVPLSIFPYDTYTPNIIRIQINYTNKTIYRQLLHGMVFYINSQVYVQEKVEKYKKIQTQKRELLHYIDNEVKKIDENEYQSMTNFKEYNDKNTADLYRFKQKLEAETIDPPNLTIIDEGFAKFADGTPSLKLYLFAFFLIGGALSISIIYLIEFIKKNVIS
jgi:hypothetical protein